MNNILKLNISTKQELLKMYIQQFKYGGLFISGESSHKLGDELFLILNLPDNMEPLAVKGIVNWVSPAAAVGYPTGIGVQFHHDKAGVDVKSKIELMLGGLLQNQVNGYTF